MSADFVFAVVEIDRTQDDWQSFVTGMDDDTLRQFITATNDDLYWDEYFEDPVDMERQVRERLCEAIGICYGGSNEIGYWRDNGREFVVTGGMSWGDDPTDAMADVYMLGVLRDWRASSEVTA